MASYIGVNGELIDRTQRPTEPTPEAETAAGGDTPAPRRLRPTLAPAAPAAKQQHQRYRTAISVLVGFTLAMGGILLISRAAPTVGRSSQASAPAVPTTIPTPAQPSATPAAQLGAAVVAFAAPNGDVLGALAPSVPYTTTARYGNDWLQLDAGSGPVWVRAADLGTNVDSALLDLAPPPTATPVPTATPRPAPPQPTADTRPVVCVSSAYGEECSKNLTPGDQAVAAEIEQKSRDYSAAWLATATAQAGQ